MRFAQLHAPQQSVDGTLPQRILKSRGIPSVDEIEHTICKGAPYDPFMMRDMQTACDRIARAIENDESILIYGDYDCDGVCATAILYEYFESENARVSYYIPSRQGEGYGLGKAAIDLIIKEGIDLVITVDNGISALDEIAELTKNGVDMIVTDHHRPKDTLPSCAAVLNPHRADEVYPEAVLCGAGVAFKLICALEQTEEYALEQYGDLVAVATLGDIMPLRGENRYLVKRGLEVIANSQRCGLRAIMQSAGIDPENKVSARQVSFGIVPRINAVGRLGEVDTLIELLLTHDENLAKRLSAQVEAINTQRRNICDSVIAQARQYIAENPEVLQHRALVVVGDSWHHGVIGIVAAKLLELYHQPVLVLTKIGDELRGSARSVESFSIVEAVAACSEHLVRYGGHSMAAGLTLTEDKLSDFLECFYKYSDFSQQSVYREVFTDTAAKLAELGLEAVREISALSPFGSENVNPIILLQDIIIKEVYPIASGTGTRLVLGDGSVSISAVSFGVPQDEYRELIGLPLDVAVELSESEYSGTARLSVRLVSAVPKALDVQAMNAQRDSFIRAMQKRGESGYKFTRAKLVVIYKLLKQGGKLYGGEDLLYLRLKDSLDYFDILSGITILKELGLIVQTTENGGDVLLVQRAAEKLDMRTSTCFNKLLEQGLAESPS